MKWREMTPASRRELLAPIPFQLGFMPDNSLVSVLIDHPAPGEATVKTIDRIGLAPREDGKALAAWIDSTTGQADAVASVVYCQDAARAATVMAAIAAHVTRPVGLLAVTPDGWFDALEENPRYRPYPDVDTLAGARMVLTGHDYAPSREAFFGTS